jgi:hypothetical protein
MERSPPPEGPGKPAAEEGRPRRRSREFASRGDRASDPVIRNLKLAFAEVEAEPLPEELADLVARIQDMDLDGGRRDDH